MKPVKQYSVNSERKWQIQEAKNRLSYVVDKARREWPQTITLRGKPAVVVISVEQYQKITRPAKKLLDFFKKSPLYDVELGLKRSKETGREIDLWNTFSIPSRYLPYISA